MIILTDDSGYSDLGVYGSEIPTPNIDALAREGIRFSKFYNNGRCSQTRASLLTGQYPQKVGLGDLARPQDETQYPGYMGYLSPASVTLAEVLRNTGYTTLMSGKWHLGGQRQTPDTIDRFEPLASELSKWPNARGFDEFYGTIHGHISYFRPKLGVPFVRQNEIIRQPPSGEFYATDRVTDEAIEMMRRANEADAEAPFFLYLAYHAPHYPFEAPESALDRHREIYRPDRVIQLLEARSRRLNLNGTLGHEVRQVGDSGKTLIDGEVKESFTDIHSAVAAMMEIVDSNVGRPVEYLRQTGELNNTLIIYMSDNGAGRIRAPIANWPLRRGKGNLLEGGIASHAIVHWPAGIDARNQVVRADAHVIDLMPTIVELAGAVYPRVRNENVIPPMVGQSLTGLFRGEEFERQQPLFWAYEG